MSAVLTKVRQLEEYITLAGTPSQDRVWDLALDKLLSREADILLVQKARLETQLAEFERRYHLPSGEFHERFERGELGDEADFVEWSATYEMVQNLQRRLQILGAPRASRP